MDLNEKFDDEYCVLMGRTFMLLKSVASIPIPENYFDESAGITEESLLSPYGTLLDLGQPRVHKKGDGFLCYRASIQGPIVYYFCVKIFRKGNPVNPHAVYVFTDDDLHQKCIYDETESRPEIQLTQHSMPAIH